MAYNPELASRIRACLIGEPGFDERKMFGGIAFLLNGHMCCGVHESDLMLRLGPDLGPRALEEPHTRVMDFTGRPMANMIFVEAAGVERDEELNRWIGRARDFVRTLPPKQPKKKMG